MQKFFIKTRCFIFLSNHIRIIFYCFIFTLIQNTSLSQWIQQNSGVTDDLRGISMININTGWVCGDNGNILKTTNSGVNWINLNSGFNYSLTDIQFVNNNTGWVSTRIGGRIFKSTNGGTNWFLQFETFQSINAIYFFDALKGWAAGNGGEVFITANGGNTWDSVEINISLNDIIFINEFTGWICGGGYIYKTTDGGYNWKWQHGGTVGGILSSINFININNGWALNLELYRLYKTTNSGNNWVLTDSLPDCFNAHHILFTSINTGYVSGDCGNLFKTTNGGLNWYQQFTGTNTFRKSAYFLNDTVGWSVGGNGIIINTNTGGAIVNVTQNSEIVPDEFRLFQNYPNPFNPYTKIKFSNPNNNYIKINVYNILGQLISNLSDGYLKKGIYEIEFNSSNLTSGIYICEIVSYNYKGSILMTLIK